MTMHSYRVETRLRARTQPVSETGLYMYRHKHDWREIGSHTWTNGETVPLFRCRICSDVICSRAVVVEPSSSTRDES